MCTLARVPRPNAQAPTSAVEHDALPVVCIVTADEEFPDQVMPELMPWFQVVLRTTYDDLARWTREAGVAAVLLDIDTDGDDPHGGLGTLTELRKLNASFVLISLSRSRKKSLDQQSAEAGADAHFRSPVDLSELRLTLADSLRRRTDEATLEQLRRQAHESSRFQDFVGSSEPMRFVYDAIQQVADSNINVLIRGESGTGKELAARAIVALSRRASKPYIRLNCAALPENLIESELFGSEKGAFTGATEARPGQIELADHGTLFLDEIATLTLPLQTKLLRVLEDHQVQRLGGPHPAQNRLPLDLRNQRAARRDGTHRALPRRPVLSHPRHPHQPAATARAAGRYPSTLRLFPANPLRRQWRAHQAARARRPFHL